MAHHLLTDAELLAKLVAFDSTSSNSNLPIADFIRDYLDTPGVEIADNPNENGSKVNLLIRVGSPDHDDERSGLLLSGHMDVVPALEPDWQSDPFTLTETSDAYIGRGACDMKGFLAVAINAARRAVERRLRRPLVLLLTYDEELGTLGAQRFVETWDNASALPRNTVIGEPTSLRVVRMHKGHLVMRLTCHGRSAHSGYPQLGINAIERMAGHTTGSVSYAMKVREGGRDYDVVIANMGSINPGKKLVDGPTYPGVAEDFAETFRKQKELPCDIWVAAHGSQYNLHRKYKAGDAYDPEAFVDPEGYLSTVERYEKLYLEQLEAERR